MPDRKITSYDINYKVKQLKPSQYSYTKIIWPITIITNKLANTKIVSNLKLINLHSHSIPLEMFANMVLCLDNIKRRYWNLQTTNMLASINICKEKKKTNENKNNSPTDKMILNKMKAVGPKEHQNKMILNIWIKNKNKNQ